MRYEGVTFVEAVCKGMSRDEFIEAHKDVFWPDRDEDTRVKMLADVYERMTGGGKPAAKGKKK